MLQFYLKSDQLPEPYQHVNLLSRDKNFNLAEHDHTMFQIIWVTKGVLRVTHNGIEHHLKKGQMCIIPPGHLHALYSENGYQQVGIDLLPRHDGRGFVSLFEKRIKTFVVLDRSDQLSIVPELEQKGKQLTVLARLQLASMLDGLLLSCVEMLDSENSFRSQLLFLMNLHLSDNLTIGELSNRLAVSPSTLERITRREFGCSVMELYHQLKINRACSLIMNSDMTMKEIADSLGFFDQAHFSRFFKQKMNITPLQFKKTASI